MQRIKPEVDVVLDILKETLAANPESPFVSSLLFQYQERGGLSKKQLEGLHGKASKVKSIPPGKLATMEAIILKKPTRYKSTVSVTPVPEVKDERLEKLLQEILEKYPAHKRVVFIKTKFDNNEAITALEKSEVEKFHKLLIK
ncbi:MAG: hypothetical protein V4725_16025 [Bacteroidota bacterium]|nr:hypothetical protein [Ferruginibacter sp.]